MKIHYNEFVERVYRPRVRSLAAIFASTLLASSSVAAAQTPDQPAPPAPSAAPSAPPAPSAAPTAPPPPPPSPTPTPTAPPSTAPPPNTAPPQPAVVTPTTKKDQNLPTPTKPAGGPSLEEAPPANPPPRSGFTFGSYGRMVAATDLRGGPGRDADVVAHGSRLDEGNYVELELRRDDYWKVTDSTTRLVATLAIGSPVFHYNGDFNIKMAVRNLYMESRDLGVKNLSFWVGSRMYRGDDIYLLDWWPLDNLNTMGGGVKYEFDKDTSLAFHAGLQQPNNGFYNQSVERPLTFNQFGVEQVAILNRQKFTGSAKLVKIVPLSRDGAGLKFVAYGEVHRLPEGQEQDQPGVFESLPADDGYVIGAQVGAFTGQRDTHINVFVRYARGLAAYGEFDQPTELAPDKSTAGAHEFLVAVGGNYEWGPLGLMFGGYVRSFRNSSPDLDFNDVDEGIVCVRPHVFFGDIGGLAVEASYQAQQRGIIVPSGTDGAGNDPAGPLTARLFRFGVIPFMSPAGRGDYSRPQFRVIYEMTMRNDAARELYPQDDVFSLRKIEHFLGVGAEWWFNSSSYGG